MKYLVTGGAGFIGSNIVERLVGEGKDVRVIDNLSTGFEENISTFRAGIEFLKGDIRIRKDMEKAIDGIDVIIHQAAVRSVAKSVEDPETCNDVNINGTLNLLISAKKAKVKRVVYASSSSVYGDCKEFPEKETFEPKPISPYAVSKLAAEYYCRMYAATYGLETVSLRYFNVFGPRQNPESKYSAVIPAFIDMLAKDKPCTIDGEGAQARDFTYVGNVVDANLAAVTADGASGKAINVACGDEYSVTDVAEELKKIMGKSIGSVHGPRRPGDPDRSYADITLLKEILGLEPKVHFREGLEKTVDWFINKRQL